MYSQCSGRFLVLSKYGMLLAMEAQKRDLLSLTLGLAFLAALLTTLTILDTRTGIVQRLGGNLFRWLVG